MLKGKEDVSFTSEPKAPLFERKELLDGVDEERSATLGQFNERSGRGSQRDRGSIHVQEKNSWVPGPAIVARKVNCAVMRGDGMAASALPSCNVESTLVFFPLVNSMAACVTFAAVAANSEADGGTGGVGPAPMFSADDDDDDVDDCNLLLLAPGVTAPAPAATAEAAAGSAHGVQSAQEAAKEEGLCYCVLSTQEEDEKEGMTTRTKMVPLL